MLYLGVFDQPIRATSSPSTNGPQASRQAAAFAMCGASTEIAYGATLDCAMCGTDIGCDAALYSVMCSTEIACAQASFRDNLLSRYE
eukprot:2186967-Rhodomonas_salina.1